LELNLYTEYYAMALLPDCPHRVRFRTEKSLFSGVFIAKFLGKGVPTQAPGASNKKRVFGLVR
jgi:hypothetical protein